MKAVVVIGAFALVAATTVSGLAGDTLLFETWVESYFNPGRADDFIQVHGPQYTDEYFKCSHEA
ncbi:MAG: hypothetical protein ACREJU_02995, partial [Nitrospiraceae bacterium]